MTDESRKRLTVFLGECWHEEDTELTKRSIRDPRHRSVWAICTHCKTTFMRDNCGRTFDNWNDYSALIPRLKELGLWDGVDGFDWWASEKYIRDQTRDIRLSYTGWLLDPARIELIDQFLQEKEELP